MPISELKLPVNKIRQYMYVFVKLIQKKILYLGGKIGLLKLSKDDKYREEWDKSLKEIFSCHSVVKYKDNN